MNDTGPPPPKLLPEPNAPRVWRNWLASKDNDKPYWITESPLFSDAWFTSEALNRGPLNVLNALARTTHLGGIHEWKPALILRVDHHLPSEMPDMSVTSAKHYHGGWLADEVAALISLELGLRIIAGPEVREFGQDGDPLGRPRMHASALLPTLPPRAGPPQIQSLFGTRNLDELTLLNSLPELPAAAASALIKSARMYQQALWIADATPETAWLLLVSAVEIAAGFWDACRMSGREKLKLSKPGLFTILESNPDPNLVNVVAEELHQVIGSTGKFISFTATFKPDPPSARPAMGKFDFGTRSYKNAITKIYDHRSKALHDGIPFPSPMCHPPQGHREGEAPWEKPGGLGAASNGASWLEEEFPMHLHLFAHIVQGSLLNWWQSLIIDSCSSHHENKSA